MFRALASRLGLQKQTSATTGQLLAVEGPVITGWLDTNDKPDESLFSVSVDKVPASVKVTLAPGVSAKYPGRYEFTAEFGSGLVCKAGMVVTVAYGSPNAQLAGSPWYVRRELKSDFPYAFLHIPKTAGTSLRFALEAALGASRIFPCQEYLERRGGRYLSAQETKSALAGVSDDLKLIQGHYRLQQLQNFLPKAKIIAVFRSPVKRAVSLIKHKMANAGEIDASEEYLIQKYLRGDPSNNNGQVRALSQSSDFSLAPESLEQAVAALNQIDVFGVSEQYNDVLSRVSKLIEQPLRNDSLNRSRLPDREFSECFIAEVREANRLDIEFYRAVKKSLRSD